MKTHVKMNFEVMVAKDVGTDAAIILSNLAYWVFVNEHNDRNFHDGKYWSYNSVNAFSKIFSWLSKNQIKRCLTKLEDKGYIISGNYNKSAYDRTKWYTVNDITHCYKSTNGRDQTDQPIPYSKPNNKPNSKKGEFSDENTNPTNPQLDLPLQTEKEEKKKSSEQKEKKPFEAFWNYYDKKKGSKHKAKKLWDKLSLKEQTKVASHLVVYLHNTPDKMYRKNPEAYLNQRIWESEDEWEKIDFNNKPQGGNETPYNGR